MGFIDLNLNFADIFRGCFGTKSNQDNSLDMLKSSIENETNSTTIISEILLKLVNGTFDCGMIYKINSVNQSVLVKKIGNYQHNVLSSFYTINVPINKNNNMTHTLLLISKKAVKLNATKKKLIEMLEQNLNKSLEN